MKKIIIFLTLIFSLLFNGCTNPEPIKVKEIKKVENTKIEKVQQPKKDIPPISKNKTNEQKNNKEAIEKEVNASFDKFLSNVNNKDILETMNMLDPNRKDYEDKRVFFNFMFDEFDIKYSIISQSSVTIKSDTEATLAVQIKVENDPREKAYNIKIVEDEVVLNKIKGKWKISTEKFMN